jgi:uncharacterized glyoxalase superfamily protein PhnB
MKIPENHQAIMPYLIIDDAKDFLQFTERVFDSVVVLKRMRDDQPSQIMHAEISISGSTIMFANTLAKWPVANANLFVYVENADTTHRIALENGASTVMELSDQDYGRTCGVLDPFGNTWWITSV